MEAAATLDEEARAVRKPGLRRATRRTPEPEERRVNLDDLSASDLGPVTPLLSSGLLPVWMWRTWVARACSSVESGAC